MITICTACGTSYQQQQPALTQCRICQDERQFVPPGGQQWIDQSALRASHQNQWQQLAPGLLSLQTVPDFAINQRAFVLQTPHGNILWDCIAHLDDATVTLLRALGGLHAIAISHPHYYSTMQDWADAFDAPVYLHASDSEWIMRASTRLLPWHGDSCDLLPGVRLLRLGGHFAGGTVLHWAHDDGVLLSGDILQVTPGASAVSFMWSYPNMLPLAGTTVTAMLQRLQGVKFTRLYGAFAGREILARADEAVQQSGRRYLACLQHPQP